MSKSRRQFLRHSSLAVAAMARGSQKKKHRPAELPPGAPPAFGTAPAFGPKVDSSTFAAAEKLVQFEMSKAERNLAARSWRDNVPAIYERRTGPRKVPLEPELAPYSHWNPVLPGQKAGPDRDRFVLAKVDPGPLPAKDDDIAFAPVTQLSRWIEQKKLHSERLTQIYLD